VIRVLLADDHAVVLEGLGAMIGRQSDMVVVAEADCGEEAVDLWHEHRPDVALVDLRMPGLNGVDVIREIRRADAAAHIIILTTYDTEEDIYQGIRAGVRGYLLKDSRRNDVLDAIRRVHAGEMLLSPDMNAKLAQRVTEDALTDRERAVLALLAEGKSNRDIGTAIHIEESTVKSHVKSIFRKLHVVSRTEAVTVALRRSLLSR
jgi:two-component system NarL family response regulator